jgi:hypothetical protein
MDLDTFVVAMMGVVVGGIVTFIVQRKIQERAWKKEKAEKIYAPLLDQLNDVEAKLYRLEVNPSYPEWKGLRERHVLYWIKPELKEKLWKFFDVELHNFNIGLITTINEIKPQIKEEILQKIKVERRGEVQKTTSFSSEFFWDELAKLIIKKEESGYLGGIDSYSMVRSNYDQLGKDFETGLHLDIFTKDLVSKFKDKPFLEEFRKELKGFIFKNQELMREVEKEMCV